MLHVLEEQTGLGRSQLLETALRYYRRLLVAEELKVFYVGGEETAAAGDAADIAEVPLEAAFNTD